MLMPATVLSCFPDSTQVSQISTMAEADSKGENCFAVAWEIGNVDTCKLTGRMAIRIRLKVQLAQALFSSLEDA